MDKEISPESWRALYEAAVNFRDIAPWRWMYDDDLFGVQDPVSGEIGYCCIMGNLKQVFALNVYLGTEGLFGHKLLQCYAQEEKQPNLLIFQKSLMASFEDRGDLEKEDLAVMKALGLKFRGRNSWPMFRNYRPGYIPWFLEARDVAFLTLALEQAGEVVLRCRDNKNLITTNEEDIFFVRRAHQENGGLIWHDSYQQAASFEIAIPDDGPFNEVGMQRILKSVGKRSKIWEFDLFHYPQPIREKQERPYFPYAFIVLDHETGRPLDVEILAITGYVKRSRDKIIALIERLKYIPAEIQVCNGRAHDILAPLGEKMGFTIASVQRMPQMEELREGLIASLT